MNKEKIQMFLSKIEYMTENGKKEKMNQLNEKEQKAVKSYLNKMAKSYNNKEMNSYWQKVARAGNGK